MRIIFNELPHISSMNYGIIKIMLLVVMFALGAFMLKLGENGFMFLALEEWRWWSSGLDLRNLKFVATGWEYGLGIGNMRHKIIIKG